MGKFSKMLLNGGGGGTCWEYANGQKIYCYEKNVLRVGGGGVVCPCSWAIYTYMTMIFKHLLPEASMNTALQSLYKS